MDQLSAKHKQDESYQELPQPHEETQSEDQELDDKHSEKNNTSFDGPVDSSYTSDDAFKLPKDTDDASKDSAITHGPPGVTPDKVNQLVKKPKKKPKKSTGITNARKKLYQKARSLRKVVKSGSVPVKPSVKIKGSNKNFANIKKNWLKAK